MISRKLVIALAANKEQEKMKLKKTKAYFGKMKNKNTLPTQYFMILPVSFNFSKNSK